MTVAVIDPCSGATDYDATAFLLNDTAASSSAMPIAVDPTNGLVYMLQTLVLVVVSIESDDKSANSGSKFRRGSTQAGRFCDSLSRFDFRSTKHDIIVLCIRCR